MRRVALAALLALAAAAPAAHAEGIPDRGTWMTTLLPRDIDGDGVIDAYYDTDLNITWLAAPSVFGPNTWPKAMTWAMSLNVKGVTGWRLPATTDIGNDGCNYSDTGGTDCGYKPLPSSSEMAHMYYITLGNYGAPDAGAGLVNTGPFVGFIPYIYWSSTPYLPNHGGHAWSFNNNDGRQQRHHKTLKWYGWAVHDGDVPHVNATPR